MGFAIRFQGKITLSLFGIDASQQSCLVASEVLETGPKEPETRTLWEPDPSSDRTFEDRFVRLYVEVKSLTDSAIHEMAYVTDTAPMNTVSLSIGLCSFNREQELRETVSELRDFKRRTPEVRDVFVINQGARIADPGLLSTLDKPGFHHVEQGNFGGTGGFTRSMIEALSIEDPASFHLVMDDDIDLDARVIKRALQFLKYAHSDVAIGGQMLDLWRNNILFEAGAKLNRFWTVNSLGSGTDVGDPANLHFFDDNLDIDYNAWWFCMIPTRTIRAIDFSPPLFIHVDDIEYGCRMKKSGIKTIPLPGVGVWHEPFTYKKTDWMLYYDIRNRLINATAHPEISEPPDTLYVFGFIMNFVLIHRYRAARLSSRAVRDFLSGPVGEIWLDSAKAHEGLIAFLNEMDAPPLLSDLSASQFEEVPRMHLPEGTWGIVKQFVVSFVALNLPRRKGRTPLIVHGDAHPGGVGAAPYLHAANETTTQGRLYKPNRRRLWLTTLEAVFVTLSYAFRRKAASRKWKSGLPQLQTREAWVRMFENAQNASAVDSGD